MGCSRLYIVQKSDCESIKEQGKRYAKVIAMFELCGCWKIRDVFTQDTDCYIYAHDGETILVEDCYGAALKEISIDDLIKHIHKMRGEDKNYRRIPPLMGMLEGFKKDHGDPWGELAVLHCEY